MRTIFVNIDMHELLDVAESLPGVFESAMKMAANYLVPATYAHINEEVNRELKSRRAKYLEHLHVIQEGEHTWLIMLDQEAMWIEEGMSETEMIDNLLSGQSPNIKTAKDGSRYRAIPFTHSGLPSQNTPAQQTLQDTIKRELRKADNVLTGKKGIPYKKLETSSSGQPLLGKLHSLDIKTPLKTHHGPGQGWGAIGDPRQGATGIPFLQGVQIYQSKMRGPDGKPLKDRHGEDRVRRDIMTFRTVSTKHKGTGRWVHPGLEGKNFLDKGATWAEREWTEKVVPMVLEFVASQTGGG